MTKNNYPLVIIGSGIAGLSAAIHANELGIETLLISKEELPGEGNSRYAQGGIIYADPSDETLASDFIRASSSTCNLEMVELIRHQSPVILRHLLLDLAQIPFEKDQEGHYKQTKEGAHSHPRILFKGDYSGRAIVEGLVAYIKEHCSFVSMLNQYRAFEILKNSTGIVGVHLAHQSMNSILTISCPNLILATGGCAGLYQNTSNYQGAIGDGVGMAIAAGVEVKDLEFIQFHPTTLYLENSNLRFLISEAVRGEGALLRNLNGERFMPRYHQDAELASRDIVSKSIVEEMRLTNHPCVYLDVSNFDVTHFRQRFPTIASNLETHAVEYKKIGIPVVPSAHFTCGGIVTDLWGACRSMPGLYAAGEVACTGLHGANRLASSALLEGMMMGVRSVSHISCNRRDSFCEQIVKHTLNVDGSCEPYDYSQLATLLWQKVGIERNDIDLKAARAVIDRWLVLADERGDLATKFWINSLLVADKIAQQSLVRKNSIGCFIKA